MARVRGARRQALHLLRPGGESGLAIANVLGTGVQLNGDGLDPVHGLAAVAAATGTNSHYNFKFQFKVESLKLDVTSSLNHWHIYSPVVQAGHLVVAGQCRLAALSSELGH
jgi:hypothetical protein